jgi:hypothetical protein
VYQLCRTAFGADAVLVLSDAAALASTTAHGPAPRRAGRHGDGSHNVPGGTAETGVAGAGLSEEKEENGIVVAGAFALWWRHTTEKAGTSVTATAAIKAAWRSALQTLPATLDPCPFALDRVVLPSSVHPPAVTTPPPGEPAPACAATAAVSSASVSWTGVDVNAAFAAAQRRGARRAATGVGTPVVVTALAAPDDAAWGAFD